MNTPAIRALAKAKPDAGIHILTQIPSDQIFEFSPYVSKVHVFPQKGSIQTAISLTRRLRNESYSIVVDFQGLPKTAVLSRLIGVPTRIGHNFRGRAFWYTHSVNAPGELVYSAQAKLFILTALNIKSDDLKLDFFTGEEDQLTAANILKNLNVDPDRLLISVSPVSRKAYKVWPAQKFAKVCDYLIQEYKAQILFLWGPGEYHFIQSVRNHMRNNSLPDYNIPSIRETVALLEKSDLHFGNDNGPMHFAYAAGIPTVAIFGRPAMENWLPLNNKKHLGIEYNPGCKLTCTYPECGLECLDINWESVTNLIETQISNTSGARTKNME